MYSRNRASASASTFSDAAKHRRTDPSPLAPNARAWRIIHFLAGVSGPCKLVCRYRTSAGVYSSAGSWKPVCVCPSACLTHRSYLRVMPQELQPSGRAPARWAGACSTQRANCQPEPDNNHRGRQNDECTTNEVHLCAPAISPAALVSPGCGAPAVSRSQRSEAVQHAGAAQAG